MTHRAGQLAKTDNDAVDALPALLGGDIGYLLARASGMAIRAVNMALEPTGLRARQFTVLRVVAQEAPTQRRIADLMGMDPSNVVTLIDDLERSGLVERRPDPRDRRARAIAATAAGRRVLRTAETLATAVQDEVTGALSAQQRRSLTSLLRMVVQSAG